MERSAMECISDRLAAVEGLYFPSSFTLAAAAAAENNHSRRRSALLDLLSRDIPIFLERYGAELTAEELRAFEAVEDDYEVGWHLNRLRSAREPTAEQERARVATVKNRRRAYMEELVSRGEYFSEEAMREREPYLHHEYVGRFQDPTGRAMPRPGERWSETLMRRADEAVLVGKIRGEQQRLGVDRREWVGGGGEVLEEEEDDEEEEDKEEEEEDKEEEEQAVEGNIDSASAQKHLKQESLSDDCGFHTNVESTKDPISAIELQDQLDQFTRIMQQKFLAGEDSFDYSSIDNNERLDDHWLKEANHDAEEKYFAED